MTSDSLKDSRTRRRSDFFTTMAWVLLLLVVAGFVPTLYARPLFAVPPIPRVPVSARCRSIGLVHLVRCAIDTDSHWLRAESSSVRRVGASFGAVVVAASLMTTLGVVSRVSARGFDLGQDASVLGFGVTGVTLFTHLSGVVWGNVASVVSFTCLLLAGVGYRRRPDAQAADAACVGEHHWTCSCAHRSMASIRWRARAFCAVSDLGTPAAAPWTRLLVPEALTSGDARGGVAACGGPFRSWCRGQFRHWSGPDR